jgi:hypothetical protein
MSQSWYRCSGSICATPHLLHDAYNTRRRPLEATGPAAFYPDQEYETQAQLLR